MIRSSIFLTSFVFKRREYLKYKVLGPLSVIYLFVIESTTLYDTSFYFVYFPLETYVSRFPFGDYFIVNSTRIFFLPLFNTLIDPPFALTLSLIVDVSRGSSSDEPYKLLIISLYPTSQFPQLTSGLLCLKMFGTIPKPKMRFLLLFDSMQNSSVH